MPSDADSAKPIPPTKRKLVEATIRLILRNGYAATGVDQICTEAGVTKGAFFHYFKSKEEIGHAALGAWTEFGMGIYAQAKADPTGDPLDQLHRLFDIMTGIIENSEDQITCVVGIMAQETSISNEALRTSCNQHLTAWAEFVTGILTEAKQKHPPRIDFDPESLAWMLNSLWQGSMLIGKARQKPSMIVENLRHARAYVDGLFHSRVASSRTKSSQHGNQKSRRTLE
jgi:TetR/AcrR family transcriptional repressor of nem operon